VRLTTEKREQQAKEETQDQAGDDWEIKGGMRPFDPDIARQTSEPAGPEAAPKGETNKQNDGSDYDQKFPKLVGHGRRSRWRATSANWRKKSGDQGTAFHPKNAGFFVA